MKVFSDFHARCKFEKSLNASLIPKILGATNLKDLRPFILDGGNLQNYCQDFS